MAMENKPGAQAGRSHPILCRHHDRDVDLAVAQFSSHRSREGVVLGRDSERSRRRTVDGGHHDDGVKPKSYGKARHSGVPEMGGLARHRSDAMRLYRRLLHLEIESLGYHGHS